MPMRMGILGGSHPRMQMGIRIRHLSIGLKTKVHVRSYYKTISERVTATNSPKSKKKLIIY